MRHMIVGYGYCGHYLASLLNRQGATVSAIARTPVKEDAQNGPIDFICGDITQQNINLPRCDYLYYLVPPNRSGNSDETLKSFLQKNTIDCEKIIYFGSSGVYGDHQGRWVTEDSPCHVRTSRQKRRLDAENQWRNWAKINHKDLILMRVAGIYGPGRIPRDKVYLQQPVLAQNEAPFVNSIYVEDLVAIAYELALRVKGISVFNLADGQPSPIGSMQLELARLLGCPEPSTVSLKEMLSGATEFKRELLQTSKKLSIEKLSNELGPAFKMLSKQQGLANALKEKL